jgi:hypothetical protein
MAVKEAGTVKHFYDLTRGVKLNYLISYVYLDGQAYKLTTEYRHMIENLYLDSGAFSKAKGQREHRTSISEYLKYLKMFGDKFDVFFNLDDRFDDPDHNELHQKILEEGLPPDSKKPVPVVHDERDLFGEFEKYVHMGHEFIAFGSGNKKLLDEVLGKVKEQYPQVRVHVFGDLSREMLRKHKPYSADSTGWATSAGTGDIHYWDKEEKEEQPLWVGGRDRQPKGKTHFHDFAKRKEVEDFLDRTFGFKYPDDLVPDGSTINRQLVNLYFYKELEEYINSLKD